jgi:hypothetical protein
MKNKIIIQFLLSFSLVVLFQSVQAQNKFREKLHIDSAKRAQQREKIFVKIKEQQQQRKEERPLQAPPVSPGRIDAVLPGKELAGEQKK